MIAKLHGHFWLILLSLALLVGLGALWARSRHGVTASAAAPLTPDSPVVSALRKSAKNANLVICITDAARADHFGCYGYPRQTTPNIDALARESLKFDEHFCQFSRTKPSTASLFTGQYPDTHLVDKERSYLDNTFTMARGLQAAGLETALFSSNPNASPGMGIGLDFQETYDQTQVKPLVTRRWEGLTRPEPLLTLFQTWLSKHKRSRFFAYVHFDPPHQPYVQPNAMTALFKGKTPPNFRPGSYKFPVGERKSVLPYAYAPVPEWINLYDANLRYGDWAVGELERMLKDAGVFDNTLLIVTADHGEAFGEHGYFWHERGVYDELVHIPLLIRWPKNGVGHRTIGALTQTIDLLPTIFDAFNLRYPRDGVQGRSLLPLIAGTTRKINDYAFTRSDGDPPSYLMRSLDYSLILYGNGKWRELYDVKSDPGQRRDVLDQRPTEVKAMIEGFRAFARTQRRQPLEFIDPGVKAAPAPASPSIKTTADVRKQLRGLGYLK
ncbi:MAG: sulfatase [Armatimonadota bacterium]|jgi:arylsulfatase